MTHLKERLVVLSNKNQYDRFLGEGYDPKDFHILCDNEPFYPFLDTQGISYEKIDEFLLRSRWEDINRWGWSKGAGLIRLMRAHGHFKDLDLPSVVFTWLSFLLSFLLKNHCYAIHIIEKFQPAEVLIFSSQREYAWPGYSGNAFLNHFLKETAASRQVKFRLLKMEWGVETFRPPRAGLKETFRTILKKIIHRLYGMWVRPAPKIDVMACGTLRHLGPTMIDLKKKEAGVAFYDDEFRIEHFLFSLKNRIPYLIPACFSCADKYYDAGLVERLNNEISKFFAEPFMKDYFLFDAHDFGPFIQQNFFGKMGGLFKKIACEAAQWEALLRSVKLGSLLLHEDYNARAFLAAFMKRKKVPVFSISHANWVIDFAVAQEDQVFSQSYTFVMSQHEKESHLMRGWNGDEIVITGIPRYDRLIKMARERLPLGGPVRILFCAGLFLPFSADTHEFLGLHIFAFRRHQERAVRMLVNAAQDLPVTIVIKPQFEDDEPLWRQFAEKELPRGKAEVVKASTDYSRLLMETDAMALCLWSSTLVEAGLANVPTYYLNLDDQNSEQIKRYSSSGLCEVFEDEALLRTAFTKLCSSSRERDSQRILSSQQKYYLGSLDGNATSRVTSFILKEIEKK